MNDLVLIENKNIFTTSNIIGEEFGILHNEILKKIRGFIGEISPVRFKDMFQEFEYENSRKRKYKSFKINRDGYMFLIMNISTKKAHTKKLNFIDAFNKMETILLNQQNLEWTTSREQGKQIRKLETDAICEFVSYAINQGSKNAKMYYKHYTNATYKALTLLEHKKPKTRETLDLLELHQLLLAEDLIRRTLIQEMQNKEHYKAIFEKCKQALENFAIALNIKGLK